ncbi:unnamed protein product [Linum trigynum]|uniref:Uncharacterized protein n=1 Tax=Linum trigynum TaxID=586398 RepID=A0AAV2CG85_9ROSI
MSMNSRLTPKCTASLARVHGPQLQFMVLVTVNSPSVSNLWKCSRRLDVHGQQLFFTVIQDREHPRKIVNSPFFTSSPNFRSFSSNFQLRGWFHLLNPEKC